MMLTRIVDAVSKIEPPYCYSRLMRLYQISCHSDIALLASNLPQSAFVSLFYRQLNNEPRTLWDVLLNTDRAAVVLDDPVAR